MLFFRRSFELEASLADKNPSTLIRVVRKHLLVFLLTVPDDDKADETSNVNVQVKLEEVRENPMMDDILKDEEGEN